MKMAVKNLNGEAAGEIELSDKVFGLEPRADILQRVVRWQLAKRQQGTHSVLEKDEISRTSKKMYGQKKTGNARHGSARVGIFRGGAKIFGPHPRSHAHALPKKVRALGLKFALSSKAKDSHLIVIENSNLENAKTKQLNETLKALNLSSALVVDGTDVNENLSLAARNLHTVQVLPVQGINVYDILKRDVLVLTRAAVEALEARLS